MSHFPKPLPLDESIAKSRKKRIEHLLFAARWGILIRFSIVVIEILGYYLFDSHALLMDGLASSLDIASTLFLILALFLATKPPDEEHPFGHGRYEPLAGMLLGVLLTVIGCYMFFSQGFELVEPDQKESMAPYVWLIPLGAVFLLEVCYQIAKYAAKKQGSPALLADAIHYRIDALTSLFAAAALIVGALIPGWGVFFDQLGATLIALLMVVLGLIAARKNVQQLMDRAPSREYFSTVEKAALEVSGVLATEKVRIQLYGPDAHVDIDIEVDPKLSVDASHKISQHVRRQIQKAWPKVRDVTVHIEPYYPQDH
jgi:cation diffusion facilitator family transporter